jgi:tRNA(Ile)-lysidine synthase
MLNKNLFNKGDVVAIALSGGKDSVCLFHLVLSCAKELDIEVKAINVEHGIRGQSSIDDSAFVNDFCSRLGIELKSYSVNVPEHVKKTGFSEEQSARILRYECFDNALMDGFCDKIATAHHLDDNVETVLFNLTRGTGLEGLCGIPDKRGRFIRPILTVSRAEIEEYCRSFGIEYVTDSTNLCDDYTRNKIRHKVIPILKEINPSVVETVKRTTDNLKEISWEIAAKTEEYIKAKTLPDGSL